MNEKSPNYKAMELKCMRFFDDCYYWVTNLLLFFFVFPEKCVYFNSLECQTAMGHLDDKCSKKNPIDNLWWALMYLEELFLFFFDKIYFLQVFA